MTQIEEVKQKTDIVALIGERVKLTKAGKHYKGLCPFHSEKTPSFTVSPELQIFKCFGCGESGDCFTFLEKYEGMEFSEALRYLADKAGIKLERENFGQTGEKELMYAINDLASKYYHYLLTSHASGKVALDYLLTTRQINKDSIETFCLGYAPNNPQSLMRFLVKKKYKLADIEKAGLATFGKDRFRGRVIFPLLNHMGNTAGLAGRIMPGMDSKLAKYINSPETPVYHKSSILYGLNITRGFIKKSNQAVVVEGELDMISSFQAGIKNIVAIKGTALTEEQVRMLSRLCSEVVLALDADLAGNSAAKRGIAIAQNAGLSIKIMQSKTYKDPDEFAKSDPEGYKKAIDEAIGVWDFLIDSSVERHGTTGQGIANISRDLVPQLASIEDEIVRDSYARQLAQKLGVQVESVINQIQKFQKTANVEVQKQETKSEAIPTENLREMELLAFSFVGKPEFLLEAENKDLIVTSYGIRLLEFLEKYLENNQTYSIKGFSGFLPPEMQEKFNQLVLEGQQFDETSSKSQQKIDSQMQLIRQNIKRQQEIAKLK